MSIGIKQNRGEGEALAILAEVERHGYLARVAAPTGAYLPCRAPAAIRVVDLWRALGGGMGAPDGDPLGRLLAGAADATARALGATTVQDLIDAGPRAAAEPAAPTRENLTEPA